MTPDIVDSLLAGRSVSDVRPWSLRKLRKVDNWCRALCETLAAEKRLSVRVKLSNEDESFVSFISGWFHRPEDVRQTDRGLEAPHLVVNFCRLAPVFCFSEGTTHIAPRRSAEVEFGPDVFRSKAVERLTLELQPALESNGLKRLIRKKCSAPLPDGTNTEGIHGRPPFVEFDAYFYRRG